MFVGRINWLLSQCTGALFGGAVLLFASHQAYAANAAGDPIATTLLASPIPAETTTHQLNQLFQFETTPDITPAGTGYATLQANYFDSYSGTRGFQSFGPDIHLPRGNEIRFQLQGQYGISDNFAVGAYLPVIFNFGGDKGTGDLGIYGQYKLDRWIDPRILDVTVQLDVIFPTGDRGEFRDDGNFGARPGILVYKDFGQLGPGILGAYGFVGYTIRSNSDVRSGLAATYQIGTYVGVLEIVANHRNDDGNLIILTPGLVYRGVPHFDLGIGLPFGLNENAPSWGVTLRATYAF